MNHINQLQPGTKAQQRARRNKQAVNRGTALPASSEPIDTPNGPYCKKEAKMKIEGFPGADDGVRGKPTDRGVRHEKRWNVSAVSLFYGWERRRSA